MWETGRLSRVCRRPSVGETWMCVSQWWTEVGCPRITRGFIWIRTRPLRVYQLHIGDGNPRVSDNFLSLCSVSFKVMSLPARYILHLSWDWVHPTYTIVNLHYGVGTPNFLLILNRFLSRLTIHPIHTDRALYEQK